MTPLKGKKMTDNFFPVSGWASDETFQRLQGDHGDQEIVQVSERNTEGNNLKRNIKKVRQLFVFINLKEFIELVLTLCVFSHWS
jgi:hypothetical protein